MKKFVLGLFALVMTLAFCAVPADAASSKKKKETKKEEKKQETKRSESHSSGPAKHYLSGTNTMGRAGLLFGDTPEVAALNKVEGSAHFLYSSPASGFTNIEIPFGGHFGIAENLELSAAGDFISLSGGPFSSSAFAIDLGGKYKFHVKTENLGLGLGGDVLIPTSGGNAIFTPRGMVSYTLSSGMLLNGDLGIHISTATYVSVDAGLGYPFSNTFTGIVEIGANQGGNGNSLLSGGVRIASSDSLKFQALLGIPLNGGGVQLGGGIILASN